MEEPKMTINIEEINNMINVFDNNIKQVIRKKYELEKELVELININEIHKMYLKKEKTTLKEWDKLKLLSPRLRKVLESAMQYDINKYEHYCGNQETILRDCMYINKQKDCGLFSPNKNGICKYYKENETITESPVWYFIEDVDIKELEKYRYVGKAVIGEFIKLRGF
jgi:hypothetical protein